MHGRQDDRGLQALAPRPSTRPCLEGQPPPFAFLCAFLALSALAPQAQLLASSTPGRMATTAAALRPHKQPRACPRTLPCILRRTPAPAARPARARLGAQTRGWQPAAASPHTPARPPSGAAHDQAAVPAAALAMGWAVQAQAALAALPTSRRTPSRRRETSCRAASEPAGATAGPPAAGQPRASPAAQPPPPRRSRPLPHAAACHCRQLTSRAPPRPLRRLAAAEAARQRQPQRTAGGRGPAAPAAAGAARRRHAARRAAQLADAPARHPV